MRPLLSKIYASHSQLKGLWRAHSGEIVSAWQDTVMPGLREAKLKPIFEAYSTKGYSESLAWEVNFQHEIDPQDLQFKLSALADGDNLLDFLSSRATTSQIGRADRKSVV